LIDVPAHSICAAAICYSPACIRQLIRRSPQSFITCSRRFLKEVTSELLTDNYSTG